MLNTGKDINIIVADRHTVYRKALCNTIKTLVNVNIISEAMNAVEAAQLMREETYQLLFLDDMIANSLTLIRHLSGQYPGTYIIVTGMMNDLSSIQKLYASDCRAYLLKDTDASEMIIAIEMVMAGEKYYPEWMKE